MGQRRRFIGVDHEGLGLRAHVPDVVAAVDRIVLTVELKAAQVVGNGFLRGVLELQRKLLAGNIGVDDRVGNQRIHLAVEGDRRADIGIDFQLIGLAVGLEGALALCNGGFARQAEIKAGLHRAVFGIVDLLGGQRERCGGTDRRFLAAAGDDVIHAVKLKAIFSRRGGSISRIQPAVG